MSMVMTPVNKYPGLCALMLYCLLSLPALAQDDTSQLREPYTVNPGDVLIVSVWKEEDLAQEVLVLPDGTFSFPLAGDIRAEGRTISEIRTELTERLSQYIPDLVVTVATKLIGGNKIYVIGQVARPGEFVVNPNVDVMQALSMAGGTTVFAEIDDIRILRRVDGEQTAIKFKYNEIKKGKHLEQNIMLQAGDVVVVP